jgi:hypothetical protein
MKSIQKTIRNDQVGHDQIPSTDEQNQEVGAKYNKAVRILGEKELEIEILRELLKKKNPAQPKNTK